MTGAVVSSTIGTLNNNNACHVNITPSCPEDFGGQYFAQPGITMA